MGNANAIVKLEGLYLEWSSLVDAPVTFGMTTEEFVAYYEEENGRRGLDDLDARLDRVDAKGTSVFGHADVQDTIWLNRAAEWLEGFNHHKDRRPLFESEIIEWWVRRKVQPTMLEIRTRRMGFAKCDPCVADDGHGGGMRCVCWGTGVREPARKGVSHG